MRACVAREKCARSSLDLSHLSIIFFSPLFQFMNLVLDGAVDDKARADMGMVVIRGASVVTIEALEFVEAGGGGRD